MTPRPVVSFVIPTQRRPEGLARAARSLFRQAAVDLDWLELVVVDNDQYPSARGVALSLTLEAPFPVIYLHEPRSGVAHARNAAVANVSGDFIAFLDDDEVASEGWLAALLATQGRYDADVVFGPVRARAPASAGAHRAYFRRFFSREGPASEGLIANHYGCGDSLIRTSALPHPRRPFCPSRNHIGGEDDKLFARMREAGARMAWSPEAWVWEDPAPSRLSLDYAIRRAFAYGQGPTTACAASSDPDHAAIARWMAIGLAQALVFGALAAAKWLVRAPDRAFALDRAARGLGKCFWWGPFKIRFYGLPAPSRPMTLSPA
ncbi:MAG: glycosyltransferase family 2 protein [Caulobacterales bacterium]